MLLLLSNFGQSPFWSHFLFVWMSIAVFEHTYCIMIAKFDLIFFLTEDMNANTLEQPGVDLPLGHFFKVV